MGVLVFEAALSRAHCILKPLRNYLRADVCVVLVLLQIYYNQEHILCAETRPNNHFAWVSPELEMKCPQFSVQGLIQTTNKI